MDGEPGSGPRPARHVTLTLLLAWLSGSHRIPRERLILGPAGIITHTIRSARLTNRPAISRVPAILQDPMTCYAKSGKFSQPVPRAMPILADGVLSEAVDSCIRFTRKINVFQNGGDRERFRPRGPKNVHNFLVTLQKVSWNVNESKKNYFWLDYWRQVLDMTVQRNVPRFCAESIKQLTEATRSI